MSTSVFPRVLLGSLALVALLGCEEKAEKPAAPPERFQAALAKKQPDAKALEGFCDVQGGPKLTLPALVGKASPGPRWVNVWATWCKACVEEMPMIETWESKLDVQVLYISTDEEAAVLESFRSAHPSIPESTRMEKPDELPEWLKKWGVDPGAGLPLHLFVSETGQIECARAGAVAEHHYDVIATLLDG